MWLTWFSCTWSSLHRLVTSFLHASILISKRFFKLCSSEIIMSSRFCNHKDFTVNLCLHSPVNEKRRWPELTLMCMWTASVRCSLWSSGIPISSQMSFSSQRALFKHATDSAAWISLKSHTFIFNEYMLVFCCQTVLQIKQYSKMSQCFSILF